VKSIQAHSDIAAARDVVAYPSTKEAARRTWIGVTNEFSTGEVNGVDHVKFVPCAAVALSVRRFDDDGPAIYRAFAFHKPIDLPRVATPVPVVTASRLFSASLPGRNLYEVM
jgi:hypothetical protein